MRSSRNRLSPLSRGDVRFDRLRRQSPVYRRRLIRPNMSRLVPPPLHLEYDLQQCLDDADTMLYDPLFDFYDEPKALDGLTGVPTLTTATLTPTTLRSIEQTFLNLQCQEEPHHNQAGFVPPVVQPVTQGNGIYMSVVDTKAWGGGSTIITADSHSSNDSSGTLRSTQSITPPAPMRRMGGRRPKKDQNISPEEEERRYVRRERNKLAAARCRKRRLDHTNELVEETEGLEEKKQSLQQEIQQLQMEKEDLQFILETHIPHCRLKRSDTPPDVKPFNLNATRVLVSGMPMQVKVEPNYMGERKQCRPRPTSLPVSAFNPRKPVTECAGIPLTTPTAGIPFNFDSLMDGGTGLTPVSAPLVPSCSSQQRNGCVDLSSPEAMPNKLVSL